MTRMNFLDGSEFHPASAPSQSRAVALDMERLQLGGLSPPSRGRSVHTEEFRRIKQRLMEVVRHGDSPLDRTNLIAVTSALPGEGKTSTAINLALSLSMEIDTSVLLVDADVLRQDLMTRLGMGPLPGLLDYLSGATASVENLIVKTNIPKLSVLPAGRGRDDAAELVTSQSMDAMLRGFARAGRGHVVVFDSPPLLLSTEARALVRSMGQVLVVVEAGKTPRTAIVDAFDSLVDCPNVSAVLNKTAVAETYGYGDYYR
jgi:receptor protein-tyrosine kinase